MPLSSVHPVRLLSDRVLLREVESGDAEAAFEWGSDPEYFTFLPFKHVETFEEERDFIADIVRVANEVPRLDYHLAVVDMDASMMVGLVDLLITSTKHRSAELGFGLRRGARGRGLATEAARLILGFGFSTLGLHRVSASHHPDNNASGRVLERVGLTREGRLRENLLAHGRWRDSVVYSVLETEWERTSPAG